MQGRHAAAACSYSLLGPQPHSAAAGAPQQGGALGQGAHGHLEELVVDVLCHVIRGRLVAGVVDGQQAAGWGGGGRGWEGVGVRRTSWPTLHGCQPGCRQVEPGREGQQCLRCGPAGRPARHSHSDAQDGEGEEREAAESKDALGDLQWEDGRMGGWVAGGGGRQPWGIHQPLCPYPSRQAAGDFPCTGSTLVAHQQHTRPQQPAASSRSSSSSSSQQQHPPGHPGRQTRAARRQTP